MNIKFAPRGFTEKKTAGTSPAVNKRCEYQPHLSDPMCLATACEKGIALNLRVQVAMPAQIIRHGRLYSLTLINGIGGVYPRLWIANKRTTDDDLTLI